MAGTARGRMLVAPWGTDVRPTSDRVREALFNSLGSLGVVVGATVLDAFAGSGALGIEALSRGAGRATLVEREREALAAVKANLAAADLADRAIVVRGDLAALLERSHPALAGPFDLVLADPPYAFDRWAALLACLRARLGDDGVVVAESDRSVDPGAGWRVLREKQYGGTVVMVVTPSPE